RGLCWGGEAPYQGGRLVRVGEHQDVVAFPQDGVGGDGEQGAVPDDEGDPGVLAAGEVGDQAAVGGGAGGDVVAVQALGLLAEADAEGPRLRLDAAQRDAQAMGQGGDQAA